MNITPLRDLVVSPNGFGFRSDTGEIFQLNSSAMEVLSRLRNGEDQDSIARSLAEEHGLPVHRTRRDISTFINHLSTLNLIHESSN